MESSKSGSKDTPLIFIDTNIWLDFYRSETEAGIRLLEHVDSISDRIIVCPQVEMEFKKNRQATILQSIKDLKGFKSVSRPGIFSDAKAAKALHKSLKRADQLIKGMNVRLAKILEDPSGYDPVYKIFQRVFHKDDPLRLTRDSPVRRTIRGKALKRFLLGYPPRKNSDTSIGDAMNWEWIIHCAEKSKVDVVLVSRDSDYGIKDGNKVYLNDHLKQEFSERVSSRRRLTLCTRLSEGLKAFQVKITPEEKEEEERLIKTSGAEPPLPTFMSSASGQAFDPNYFRDFFLAVRDRNTLQAEFEKGFKEASESLLRKKVSEDKH